MQQFDGDSTASMLIMDNLSVHHCNPIVSLLKDTGMVVQLLPSYSPDRNPIEEAFSYIKYYLKLHVTVDAKIYLMVYTLRILSV